MATIMGVGIFFFCADSTKNQMVGIFLAGIAEEFGIDAVEQPLPGHDLVGMSEIRQLVHTPIIADESIFTINDLTNVIQHAAADIICLKPFKSGGIFLSKKMQHIAEAYFLPVSTGSMHPFGIGTCALHQFISTIGLVFATGYGCPHERFVDDIADEVCYTFKNGVVHLLDTPGLGVKINLKKLEKYTTKYQATE